MARIGLVGVVGFPQTCPGYLLHQPIPRDLSAFLGISPVEERIRRIAVSIENDIAARGRLVSVFVGNKPDEFAFTARYRLGCIAKIGTRRRIFKQAWNGLAIVSCVIQEREFIDQYFEKFTTLP
jgi:hypothetical protein